MLLVGLPVAGAVAFAAVERSLVPTPEQFAQKYMGSAQFMISDGSGAAKAQDAAYVKQFVDRVSRTLGPGGDVVPSVTTAARFGTPWSAAQAAGTLVLLDLGHPLTQGMYRTDSGALGGGGAALSAALADRLQVRVGDEVTIPSIGRAVPIASVVTDRQDTSALLLVVPGTPDLYDAVDAAVGGGDSSGTAPQSVTLYASAPDAARSEAALASEWSITTREKVVRETENYGKSVDTTRTTLAVLVLVLAEVALLVAAALTMSARRRRRELGLLAAVGGGPKVRRRVLVAHGLIVGSAACLLAVPLGVLGGALLHPLVAEASQQAWDTYRINPAVTALAPVLALLTAVSAAWLTGRRVAASGAMESLRLGAMRSPRRVRTLPVTVTAALAVVLLGWGVIRADVVALVGAALAITGLTVAGTAWLLPRAERILADRSVAVRMAAREAAADTGRSVALAAAIAAPFLVTVLATSALGSAAVSAAREYLPTGPAGTVSYTGRQPVDGQLATRAAQLLDARLVGRATSLGLTVGLTDGASVLAAIADNPTLRCVEAATPATEAVQQDGQVEACLARHGGLDPFPRVAAVDLPFVEIALDRPLTVAERAAFDAGTALVTDRRIDVRGGFLALRPLGFRSSTGGAAGEMSPQARLPALVVDAPRSAALPLVLVKATRVPQGSSLRPVPEQQILFAPAQVPSEQVEDLVRAVLSSGDGASSITVERGPQGERTALRVLAVVGVLLLLGTVSVVGMAVALAAGQLRQDYATLAAVGAAPRLRRQILATQAGALAVVGVAAGVGAGTVGAVLIADATAAPLWPPVWLVVATIGLVAVGAAVILGAAVAPKRLLTTRRPG